MGFFDNLFQSESESSFSPSHSHDIEKITKALSSLSEQKARFYAAISLLLGRAAYADHEFSEREENEIKALLIEKLKFSNADAALVARLSRERTIVPNVENHIFVKVVKENTSPTERLDILSMLFQVAGSEDGISSAENEEIRLISIGLAISHESFIATRSKFRDQLNVLKKD